MIRKPVYNRLKEVMIGTDAKVNPCRTIARRMMKTAIALGQPLMAYWCWLLGRLQGDSISTRFYVAEAAEAMGVNEKTIDRFNRKLVEMGFLTITKRNHAGRRTYSEYQVNTINGIIDDVGTKLSPRAGTKLSPPRGAYSGREINSSPVSALSLTGLKEAEAGRASPEKPASASTEPGQEERHQTEKTEKTWEMDPLRQRILAWLDQHQTEISSCGFRPRRPESLASDIMACACFDGEFWTLLETNWPIILRKLRGCELLKKANHNFGFGWLFLPSKRRPDETNLQVALFSQEWGGLAMPTTIYSPGTRVLAYGRPAVVVDLVEDSLTRYWCCSPKAYGGPEQQASQYSVAVTDIKPSQKVTSEVRP